MDRKAGSDISLSLELLQIQMTQQRIMATWIIQNPMIPTMRRFLGPHTVRSLTSFAAANKYNNYSTEISDDCYSVQH